MMPDRVEELAALKRRKDGPKLGNDGIVPPKYQSDVRNAIEIAWRLGTDTAFVEIFRQTIAELSRRFLTSEVYAVALNKMIINCADNSKNPRIAQELQADAKALKIDRLYQAPLAFSFVDGADIWIRTSQLAKGQRAIAGSIIHEAAHLVGAPNNLLAEIALDRIHQAAGLSR